MSDCCRAAAAVRRTFRTARAVGRLLRAPLVGTLLVGLATLGPLGAPGTASAGSAVGVGEVPQTLSTLVSDTGLRLTAAQGRLGLPQVLLHGTAGRAPDADPAGRPEEDRSGQGAPRGLRYPDSAVVRVDRYGRRLCTGWLAGPDTLVTAGHCLHTGGASGTWITGLSFAAAAQPGAEPSGQCHALVAYALAGWLLDASSDADVGVVRLDCAVGEWTGWLGMWWQRGPLEPLSAVVVGFGADSGGAERHTPARVTWSSPGRVFYRSATVAGQSGSPVIAYRSASAPSCHGGCVIAVHSNGVGALSATDDSGTRLSEGAYDAIMAALASD